MKLYPKTYTKKEFIDFLIKNKINNNTINKFKRFPEKIVKNNETYSLYISVVWYNVKKTYYEFELNYYSKKLIEFLFNSKVFNDVKKSINNLLCELENNNFLEKK